MGPNIRKMLAMVARMESFQAEIEKYEDEAIAKVKAQAQSGTLQGNTENLAKLYLAASEVEEEFWYKRAVSKRNLYAMRARTYATVAMALGETVD